MCGGGGKVRQPTQDGYYWFKGTFRGLRCDDIVKLSTLPFTGRWAMPTERGGLFHLEDFEGEWWGPLTSPWEEENNE